MGDGASMHPHLMPARVRSSHVLLHLSCVGDIQPSSLPILSHKPRTAFTSTVASVISVSFIKEF